MSLNLVNSRTFLVCDQQISRLTVLDNMLNKLPPVRTVCLVGHDQGVKSKLTYGSSVILT